MNALLIAGTDSHVGKTIVTLALAAYWQHYWPSRRWGVIKPIQCGVGDRELYGRLLSLGQSPDEINPVYFEASLLPPLAALQEGRSIEMDLIWQRFQGLLKDRDFVLVDSTGGLGAPLTRETTVADLAWDWHIPTVLVVPVQPGTVAQSVANVALARQARVNLKGVILNCTQPCHLQDMESWAPIDLIQSLTQKPVLGYVPHLSEPTDLTKLAQIASTFDLERLVPSF